MPKSAHAYIGGSPECREWRANHDAHPDHQIFGQPGWPDIHHTATLEAYVTVDGGTERRTSIGERTWLMKHAHVGHDALVGPDCELAPGAKVGGWAELEGHNKVGMNAVILPYVRVGAGAQIGAGAVVTKHVPAGETWVGNPAAKLQDHRRDPRLKSERPERPTANMGAVACRCKFPEQCRCG